jgi:hypothetical protein
MKSIQNLTGLRHGRFKWVRAFLEFLRNSGNVTQSARYAGVSRVYVYQAAARHPFLKKSIDAAIDESSDLILAEAHRRAIEGINEPVVFQGRIMGEWILDGQIVQQGTPGATFMPLTIKRYSDMILKAMLEARVPGFKRQDAAPSNVNVNVKQSVKVAGQDVFDRVLEFRRAIDAADGPGQGSDPAWDRNGESVGGSETNGKQKAT